MASLLRSFFSKKKPLPGLVTVCSSIFFMNRPSPSPYAKGNNNPDNYRDPYGVDYGLNSFHKYPFTKYGFLLTIRFHLVKQIFIRSALFVLLEGDPQLLLRVHNK
jgi:hypothetical protein